MHHRSPRRPLAAANPDLTLKAADTRAARRQGTFASILALPSRRRRNGTSKITRRLERGGLQSHRSCVQELREADDKSACQRCDPEQQLCGTPMKTLTTISDAAAKVT